jgi:hypothetical protein
MIVVYLLLLMLVFLGEAVGFSLEALGFRLVDDALHAATLTVTVSLVHFLKRLRLLLDLNYNSNSQLI